MNAEQNGHEPNRRPPKLQPATIALNDLTADDAQLQAAAQSLHAAYENQPLVTPSIELRQTLAEHLEELRPMPKPHATSTNGLVTMVPILGGSLVAIVIASAIFMWPHEEIPQVATSAILVPVATRDLPAGHVVLAEDIEQRPMTPAQLAETRVPLDVMMINVEQIVGRQLRKPLLASSPVATTSVYIGSYCPASPMLKPGYRAIAVTVPIARGGYAQPGDVVDVYFTSRPKAANSTTGQRAIPMKTIPVVHAVPVLEATRPSATANRTIRNERRPDPSFLLQVLPDQVAKFQALAGHGDFSFMIRPEEDVTLAGVGFKKGVTLDEVLGLDEPEPPSPSPQWVTEVYHGKSRNTQPFPIRGGVETRDGTSSVEHTADFGGRPSEDQFAHLHARRKKYVMGQPTGNPDPAALFDNTESMEFDLSDQGKVVDEGPLPLFTSPARGIQIGGWYGPSTSQGEQGGEQGGGSQSSRGSASLSLSGSNTYTGATVVRGGTLTLGESTVESKSGGQEVDRLFAEETKTGRFMFGVGQSSDQHARITENAFKTVSQDPLSTFSIDVDTASYSKMRQHLLEHGQLPPPDAVRIEELINYFPYDYNEPMDEHPFAAHMEVAQCPWQPEHRLARIAIKGKEMRPDARPASNLVFLVDVSGSMNEANKLPLVLRGLTMLTRELNKHDRVAIVVYAGAAGLVLPSTTGDEQETILAALGKLEAGGSTAGAEGIQLAYKTAADNFIHAGVNRVILCTDGDFNVGVSDTGSLVRLAEEQAKKNIFLSILGFGMGNLNDDMLEQVSNKANGMYAFIDTDHEARKVLVEQMSGTLVTIAKDVKIQIEFNPAKVAAYRLIGYENRILAAEDFNNDKKDAGEIGAGHTVTALYEIVPVVAKAKPEVPGVDELKYQRFRALTDAADSDELLTLKLRYKSPEGEKSTLLSEAVDDSTVAFGKVSDDFKFAAAVASFGMLLRGSEYAGDATFDAVLEIATDGAKHDEWGYRKEFLEIVKRAKELKR